MKHHVFSEESAGYRAVAIGGGNGLSTLLSGLKLYVGKKNENLWLSDLSAIVAVTDDGGSSGRLRDELNILPPGDVRNCMVALSEDSQVISRLFKHRFGGDGELGGHSFGNLFLAALTELTGDFAEAVRLSSEVLASKGTIFPATNANVRLGAELENGKIVLGETKVALHGPMIKRLFLDPEDCRPLAAAIESIEQADIITVGPGSLYTSLIPPLLVREIGDAIAASNAVKVFVCNLMTQPGETDGMNAKDHIDHVRKYAPNVIFDHVIVNDAPISDEQSDIYKDEGATQIGVKGSISPRSIEHAEIVSGNLLDDGDKVRHHPDKLAQVVMLCAVNKRAEKSAAAKNL